MLTDIGCGRQLKRDSRLRAPLGMTLKGGYTSLHAERSARGMQRLTENYSKMYDDE